MSADISKPFRSSSSAVAELLRTPEIAFRVPQIEDGAGIWDLIRKTGVLDLNSSYCYLMLSNYFSNTCIVAEDENKVVGFISGFICPDRTDTYFVWQVAVDPSMQGQGVGPSMLRQLLRQDALDDVRYLETTVSPDNISSEKMFRRVAEELDANFKVNGEFSPNLFPDGPHEAERIFSIGPFHVRSH